MRASSAVHRRPDQIWCGRCTSTYLSTGSPVATDHDGGPMPKTTKSVDAIMKTNRRETARNR